MVKHEAVLYSGYDLYCFTLKIPPSNIFTIYIYPWIIVLKLKGKLLNLLLQGACIYQCLLLQLFILRYSIFFKFIDFAIAATTSILNFYK